MSSDDHNKVPGRANLWFYSAIMAVAVIGITVFVTSQISDVIQEGRLKQPITISACHPDDYVEGEGCTAEYRPRRVILSDELLLPVAGDTCSTAKEPLVYEVTVEWVQVDTGATFPILGPVPLTWEPGCAKYPTDPEAFRGWTAPPTLVDAAAPGEDLGLWKIVGRAVPEKTDRFEPFTWDSVLPFRAEG